MATQVFLLWRPLTQQEKKITFWSTWFLPQVLLGMLFNSPDHLGETHKPLVVHRPQSECRCVRLLLKEKEIEHRKLLK